MRRSEVVPLTADEARTALTGAKERRNGARWSGALALGLRQGEALGLRWADVDLDHATLTVRQALQRRRGQGLVLVPPKSQQGSGPSPYPLLSFRRCANTDGISLRSVWPQAPNGAISTSSSPNPMGGWPCRYSATPRYRSLSVHTATSCRSSQKRPRSGWRRRCGDLERTGWPPCWHHPVVRRVLRSCITAGQDGADARIRTGNLPITSRLRCQIAPRRRTP